MSDLAGDFAEDAFEIEEIDDTDDSKVELSREEYEKLQGAKTADTRMSEALELLAKGQHNTSTEPAEVDDPFALPPVNDGDFDPVAWEDELFEKGKSVQAMRKLIDREMKPMLLQQRAKVNSLELRNALAENDDMKPYAQEIKQAIASLPPGQRLQEGIVQAAMLHVRQKHAGDILQSQVELEVQKRLKALGVKSDNSPGSTVRTPTESEDFSETRSRGGEAGPRKIQLTRSKRAEYERRAAMKGISFSDYMTYVVGEGD